MKRFTKAIVYILSIHVLAILALSLFRLIEYFSLHRMITDNRADRFIAFVNGLWFDNVVTSYISVLPLAVILFSACFNYYRKWMLKAIMIWYSFWFAIVFMQTLHILLISSKISIQVSLNGLVMLQLLQECCCRKRHIGFI